MQEQTTLQELINRYQKLVTRFHAAAERNRRLSVFLSVITLFTLFFLLTLFIEQTAYLSPLLKSVILGAGVVGGVALGFRIASLFSQQNRETYYRTVTKDSSLHSLRHLLDLSESTRITGEALRDSAIRQNAAQLEPDSVKKAFREWNNKTTSYIYLKRFGLAFVLLLVLILGFSFKNPQTAIRTISFWENFEKPNPFQFTILPGTSGIEQGSRFFADITFQDEKPERVGLSVKMEVEDEFRTIPMQETTPGKFISESIEVFSDLEYFIQMDEFVSETYSISAIQLPRFRNLLVEVSPPSHTGMEPTDYTYPFSRIELAEGSTIKMTGTANKELEQVILESRQHENIALEPDSALTWKTERTVTTTDTLSFQLTDSTGLTNRNPFNFTVRSVADQTPTVRLTQPEAMLQMLNPDRVNLRFEARDDYGFSSTHLRYEIYDGLSDSKRSGSVRLSRRSPASFNGTHDWDLTELNLQPADELVYWIEVFDNDTINGFKSAVSARQTIRASSLAEFLIEQDEKEDSIDNALDDLAQKNEQAREELKQLKDEIVNDPNQNWEQQRSTEDMMEQQDDMKKQLDEMMKEFEELSEQMENENILSDETLQKYEELQKLMEEIDDTEIMELLEELREGLEQMDQEKIREAMENLEFNEQAYQERLERTMELFKQLRVNAELDKMAAMMEQLEQMEERIMEMEESEKQAEQQEDVKEELDSMQEKLESLPEKGPQSKQDMLQEMVNEMSPQMQDLNEDVQQNIEQLQSPESSPSESQQQQEQIKGKMGEIRQQMQNMRSQMNQQSIDVNIMALQTIFQTLLLLSDAQEELNLSTLQLEPNSLVFIDHARTQRNISVNFNQVVDSLLAVANEVPQLPNILLRERLEVQRSLDQSIEHLVERNKNRATTSERTALGGINKLAGMVSDLIDQLKDSQNGEGSGGGMSSQQMMQQMQNMGGQQQQLNQMIQDFINDMAGERLSQDQMERLNQMAQQQNAIRKQLQDMQQRGALKPGDSLMSELERMAEEMEDAINDLRGGSVDDLMVERQQNILSRMLQAERAIDEREEDEKREGKTAEEFERNNPPEMTLEELEREIRNRLQDPDQTRFTEDYQRLIRLYFEILRELDGTEVRIP